MGKSRSEYFRERRDKLKMVSVMVEKDALDQLDDMLHAEGTTRSTWIRECIYNKINYQKTGGAPLVDGAYAICKECGKRATMLSEVTSLFGWRIVNGVPVPHPRCIVCRNTRRVSK